MRKNFFEGDMRRQTQAQQERHLHSGDRQDINDKNENGKQRR